VTLEEAVRIADKCVRAAEGVPLMRFLEKYTCLETDIGPVWEARDLLVTILGMEQ
jgi:hypothetical protein